MGENVLYKAHVNEITQQIQTVKEHCENTAALCKEFSIPELEELMYVMGLLHDIGKYQKSFQKRISGSAIRVEHSICGAKEAKVWYHDAAALILAFCIAGHHSGIPDGGVYNDTPDMPSLYGRLKRETEDYSAYQKELELPNIDEKKITQFLLDGCTTRQEVIEKTAFMIRYCFSCLTDADFLDTAAFCGVEEQRPLTADFQQCLKEVDQKLDSFTAETELQKMRQVLQGRVLEQKNREAEIYLMNMPTGSGKTLCSIKFALCRALACGKKRIIYIIPYNSIIDQTAEVFEKIFKNCAQILRHQSTFDYDSQEDRSEDDKNMLKQAAENWNAQLIITTAVQFFESVYANKRGKLRKLHHMADSILVFDEAHLMPVAFLQPCLTAISYITKYLNSEAVFLTATMPDFQSLVSEYSFCRNRILDLTEDKTGFEKFKKCSYTFSGSLTGEALLQKAKEAPSTLIVVNSRRTARELYALCGGKKFHLSTYMAAYDRKRVIGEIHDALLNLEREYPDLKDVPEDKKITVISTSLIEAGVDLDFCMVFRELAGLDHILQTGGRCNREGKREKGMVEIFTLEKHWGKLSKDIKGNITKGLLKKYADIDSPECIKEYYDKLFLLSRDEIISHSISSSTPKPENISFREYAEQFALIDGQTISVAVECDARSKRLIEQMKKEGKCQIRQLQNYAFSVYGYELEELIRQNAVKEYDCGVWCLENHDYYDSETGVLFEGKDYIL